MNKQGKHIDDLGEKNMDELLRHYIIPEKPAEAPDGFTANIMTRIALDQPALVESKFKRNLVPFISVLITLILIVSAFLIPENQSDPLTHPIKDLVKSINISLPEIDLSPIFRISMPSVIIYVVIGIFILSLFDRALFGIFKKEN
jgi:hypothetical protein